MFLHAMLWCFLRLDPCYIACDNLCMIASPSWHCCENCLLISMHAHLCSSVSSFGIHLAQILWYSTSSWMMEYVNPQLMSKLLHKIHFNIILSISTFSKQSLHFMFSNKNLIHSGNTSNSISVLCKLDILWKGGTQTMQLYKNRYTCLKYHSDGTMFSKSTKN
jgi:hypothetical protein